MSYTGTGFRKPVRSRSQLVSSGGFVRKLKTKRGKPKPVWDDSVNDLTVHKLTSQELQRNHELHQPKKEQERISRRIETSKAFVDDIDASSLYCLGRGSTSEVAIRKGALIKQGFINQERELHDLLSETDKTFAEMQDIFGDNLYKYKSVPIITKAPNYTRDSAINDISILNPDNPSKYDTLSESIVRELNASSLSDEESSIDSNIEQQGHVFKKHMGNRKENMEKYNAAFQTKVNIDHYQNLLSQNSSEVYQSRNEINLPDIKSLTEELTKSMKGSNANLNHDLLVKKATNLVTNTVVENGKTYKQNVTTTALQTFDDMKKMLDSLEGEIVEYEKETGKENIAKNVKIPSSISGYTANLLSVIIRLTHHLKQSEIQLKAEMTMRTEILDMFDNQRSVVDVLTSNLIELQESNEALKKELYSQRNVCRTNHANLKKEFDNLEARFNLALFAPNGDQRLHPPMRIPFHDMTNDSQVMPVWTEDKQ